MTSSLIDGGWAQSSRAQPPPPSTALGRKPIVTVSGDRAFRPDIQGLRAVAVILIVAFHARVPFVTGGFIGIDVFLVITGFLITRGLISEAAETGRVALSSFYARRIRRLVPSALLVILVTVLAARLWGPAAQATATARDGFYSAIGAVNYWFAGHGVDDQHPGTLSPLQHIWSLALGAQFLLVWPLIVALVIVITRGRLTRLRPAVLTIVIVALGAASAWQSLGLTHTDAPLAYLSLQSRGWELAVGALVAVAIPVLRRIPALVASAGSWVGLGLILFSAVEFTDRTPFPGTAAALPVAGTVLIVAAGMQARAGSVELLLRPRGIQFLGSSSYGWYLWHLPVMVLGPYLFAVGFGWPENLEVSGLALWFAILTHLTLESFGRHGRISRPRWFAIGAGMVATVLVVTLILIVSAPDSPASTHRAAAPTPTHSAVRNT